MKTKRHKEKGIKENMIVYQNNTMNINQNKEGIIKLILKLKILKKLFFFYIFFFLYIFTFLILLLLWKQTTHLLLYLQMHRKKVKELHDA